MEKVISPAPRTGADVSCEPEGSQVGVGGGRFLQRLKWNINMLGWGPSMEAEA